MHFPSGIAGVVVITLALMGSIGVGFLLNGASDYETVQDYDYITDVSGLYTYTPVDQYSTYSPAQNNYQYSTTLADLGTYTSGINYTEAGSANLNPIITPESGVTQSSGTFTYSGISSPVYAGSWNASPGVTPWAASINYKLISAQDLAASIGSYSTIALNMGTISVSMTVNGISHTFQHQAVGVAYFGTEEEANYGNQFGACITNHATMAIYNNYGRTCPATAESFSISSTTYEVTPVGIVSQFSINSNGTVSYVYTYQGQPTTVVKSASEVYLYFTEYPSLPSTAPAIWDFPGSYYSVPYSATTYTNVNYLDPTAGVSLSGSSVYWSNGHENGSVSWMFTKPASGTAKYYFNSVNAANQIITTLTVEYNAQWKVGVSYQGSTTWTNLGSSWPAIQITDWYMDQVQITPVKSFTNFTSYTLGQTKTLTSSGGNEPIQYYSIVKTSGAMKFACVGTSIKTGTVPGAMYNASFDAATYFPGMTVRMAFDSAAFVGTSVSVSTWSMGVDSVKFEGSFTLNNKDFLVDLTKPWALTWGNDSVSLSFSQVKKTGTTTVEILQGQIAPVVNLGGQWVIDTDLYQVGSHVEEVYDWNFGSWGLDSQTFIVAAIGLTALISVGFKLARVPMGVIDFLVIFGGCVIMWVVM